MKDFISPLAIFLVVASFNGAAAAATDSSQQERKLSSARDIPKANLGVDDWTSQLSCTADLNSAQPSLVDENACATEKDSNGQGCIWCDATAAMGTGLCVSPDQKTMIGQYWDQLCATESTDTTPAANPPTPPPTPKSTPSPTPLPTNPAPAPAPDNDNVPDALKCTMDDSSSIITDEVTCVAKKDTTSASGENCVWCSVPIIGGSCITNSMKPSVSFLCSSEEEGMTKKEGNYLRGANDDNNNGGGWKQLDSSCLGDGLAGGDEESCGAKMDSNGNACIWCDAGDDVFGICATPSQKDYLGSYMNCADPEFPVAAVE